MSPLQNVQAEAGLWTVRALAAYLARSPRSIFSDLSARKIPVLRLPSGLPRFDPADIRLWLEWGCPGADEFRRRKDAVRT